MPHWIDLLYIIFLIGILPLWGWADYRKFLEIVKTTDADILSGEYRKTILVLCLMALAVVLMWKFNERSWQDLGFKTPDWSGVNSSGLFISLGLFIGTIVNIVIAVFAPKLAQKRLDAMAALKPFFPQTPRQNGWAMAVSITAGIAEEIVYRGFLIWVLSHFMPIYATLVVQAIIFGLAHAYQGKSGFFATSFIGGILGYIYWATGSLLLPIILHSVMDMAAMGAAYLTLRRAK